MISKHFKSFHASYANNNAYPLYTKSKCKRVQQCKCLSPISNAQCDQSPKSPILLHQSRLNQPSLVKSEPLDASKPLSSKSCMSTWKHEITCDNHCRDARVYNARGKGRDDTHYVLVELLSFMHFVHTTSEGPNKGGALSTCNTGVEL
jgi:hypothetical protein